MKKRICSVCSVLLAIVMTALLFTGCNGKKSNAIVIHAGVVENAVVDYDDMAFWDDVEKATGVRFELEEMSTEKISLMFTSGDYVDVMFGGGFTDSQIQIAANSGDVVEITDEMLATYAPTWKKAFDENPDYYNAAKFDGGKLYSLPYIRTLEADRGVRDVWWINKVWLDELNLSMPKTLNDFVNILRAFKNNAGKGSIPENVMPWYFCANSIIGGQFDFLATYGLEAYDYKAFSLEMASLINPELCRTRYRATQISPTMAWRSVPWTRVRITSASPAAGKSRPVISSRREKRSARTRDSSRAIPNRAYQGSAYQRSSRFSSCSRIRTTPAPAQSSGASRP